MARTLLIAVPVAVIGAVAAFGFWFTVGEGHIGVVTRFGEAQYQTGPGLHFKTPLIDSVREIEIRERKNVEELTAATANQLPITATVSVNWTVNASSGLDLFKRYGTLDQFEQRILDPKLRQAAKASISKFQASDLIRDRNAAISEIQAQMTALMEPYPVTVNSPQIENIVLPERYLEAVMAKEQAREAAAREQYELEKQKLQAQRDVQTAEADRDATKARADGTAYATIETAKAEAESIRLKGEAEAQAIREKASSIAESATLVDYERALRWNGQMPTTVMGGDQQVLWSMK
ncbi:prohibitin family protein [Roseibium sediminis]|uniref:prohibitin family protein n=1 Tax=Roseibium sediminis TaxID=1775174 RepID=UPI00123D384E|nr:prohibitin family protein [Roseibium sediminis]